MGVQRQSDHPDHLGGWQEIDGHRGWPESGRLHLPVAEGQRHRANLVGGFEEFGLGTRVWGAMPQGFDVYYDDIAIDTKRIGPIRQ
jgi:hypothetical protein